MAPGTKIFFTLITTGVSVVAAAVLGTIILVSTAHEVFALTYPWTGWVAGLDGCQFQYAVDVALRVDDGADGAGADQVVTVAEAGGFDDRHVHRGLLRFGGFRDEYPYPYK